MKKVLIAAVLLVSGLVVKAQQEYQLSQNMFNSAAINPAAAGIDNAVCAQLIGRHQWMGWGDGAPTTYVMNVNSNLSVFGSTDKIGVGVTMFYDEVGLERNMLGKISGNYQLDLPNGKLSFGLDLGLLSKSFDSNGANPLQTGDLTLSGLTGTINGSAFATGFGAFYQSTDLYFGVSSSQLTEGTVDWQTANPSLRRHYYVTGGYNSRPFGSIVLKPSIFIKSDGSVTTMDLAVLAEYKSTLWVGASYRTGDAVIAMAGMNVPNMPLRAGVAYDFTTSDIRTTSSSGTAELFLRYCHRIEVKTKKKIFWDPILLQ